jgi:small nuclear ribonucleoprotein
LRSEKPPPPLSYLKKAHGSEVVVKLKNGVEIFGRLVVCDDMMNLVLSSAMERDPETKKPLRNVGELFIRGNNILFITLEE